MEYVSLDSDLDACVSRKRSVTHLSSFCVSGTNSMRVIVTGHM